MPRPVTDPPTKQAVLDRLHANGGDVNRTAADTGVSGNTIRSWLRRAGVSARAFGAEKSAESGAAARPVGTLAEETEAAARSLARQLQTARLGDAGCKEVAVAFGVAVDKLAVLGGPPGHRVKVEEAAPAEDYTRLSAEELHVLCELHRKAKGEPPLAQASDLDHPCVIDENHPDGGYWPNGEPPENPPDDPLGEHRKRWKHGLIR